MTYTYRCEKTGRTFEVKQSMHDDPLTVCECGGRLTKLILSPNISFKGSGWPGKEIKKDSTARI